MSWVPAIVAVHRPSFTLQSGCLLALAAVAFAASLLRRRQARLALLGATLGLFLGATLWLPLPFEHGGTNYMGDGQDFAAHREKFGVNIPLASLDPAPELHFKAHLGDAVLALADRAYGWNAESMAKAYEALSQLGGTVFAGELLLLLALTRGSRRACRFTALALATPLPLTFFGWYEVGYMAASAAAFPVLALAIGRRSLPLLGVSGALQGLHAAFHGFGLIGIAGGALAALCTRRPRWSRPVAAAHVTAFALALYLGWIVLYVVLFKLSITADRAASEIVLRGLFEAFYADRRLVHSLTTARGLAEIGITSVGVGVPVLFGAVAMARGAHRAAALAYALPALIFLAAWWPTLGVNREFDLLLGAFSAIMAACWLGARRVQTTAVTFGLLVLTHLWFWGIVLDRSMDRIWIVD